MEGAGEGYSVKWRMLTCFTATHVNHTVVHCRELTLWTTQATTEVFISGHHNLTIYFHFQCRGRHAVTFVDSVLFLFIFSFTEVYLTFPVSFTLSSLFLLLISIRSSWGTPFYISWKTTEPLQLLSVWNGLKAFKDWWDSSERVSFEFFPAPFLSPQTSCSPHYLEIVWTDHYSPLTLLHSRLLS